MIFSSITVLLSLAVYSTTRLIQSLRQSTCGRTKVVRSTTIEMPPISWFPWIRSTEDTAPIRLHLFAIILSSRFFHSECATKSYNVNQRRLNALWIDHPSTKQHDGRPIQYCRVQALKLKLNPGFCFDWWNRHSKHVKIKRLEHGQFWQVHEN